MAKTKAGLDLKSLFKDSKKYSDDLVIDLGEGASMTLGDLRAYDNELSGGLQSEMEKQRKILDTERAKINRATEEVAALYLKLEEDRKALGNPQRPSNDDPWAGLENDPLAEHVKSLSSKFEEQSKTLQAKIDKLEKSLGEAGRTYINDYARNQFDSLKSDPDFDKDLTLDGLFDYSVKQGIKRQDGIPDLKRAYDQLTAPKRQERLIKEARADARKEFEEERKREAFMPPPGAGQHSISPRDRMSGDPKQPPRTIREAVARAAQDPAMFGFNEGGNA